MTVSALLLLHARLAVLPFLASGVVVTTIAAAYAPVYSRLGITAANIRSRDVHTRAIPKAGGLALATAVCTVTVIIGVPSALLVVLAVGGLSTAAVFTVDDIRPLKWLAKLAIEVLIASATVVLAGLAITSVSFGGYVDIRFGSWGIPVAVAWIVLWQNVVNLLDGIDGLAAGVVAISAVVLYIAETTRPSPQQYDVLIASAALAGAAGGFLLVNAHPARVFMGDAGSQFLGFVIGVVSLSGVAKLAVTASLLVPVLTLAIPLADVIFALVRRAAAGRPVWEADAGHVHHLLLSTGLTQREICAAYYCATLIFGSIALRILGHRLVMWLALTTTVPILAVVAIRIALRRRAKGSGRS